MSRSERIILVIGLAAVVLMAFRVSWNALSDVARAIGADATAALLYPIVVDGLMALALVATLVLTGADRKFALRVLAAYTIASLLLNYVHGLVPALHTTSIRWGRLTDWDPANWALVLLATSLPVGSIYFGSDLVAKVLHHEPEPAPELLTESAPVEVAGVPATAPTEADESAADRPARSTALAESPGVSPRRATGRVPSTAKPTADRPRTDAEVLDEARRLTADWNGAQLTAERLRSALRVGQRRARALRDQLQAERIGKAESAEYDGSEVEPQDGPDEDAPQQREPGAALANSA
ncbi:DUF2637 domain-containing protein [Streptomyces cavernicola]|uniref:DUF2637 domain-containing protein n=1 Tax=Streptomyces cavernicola TaxID=3043613 RepID=A0ABT6S427_9ACTN|nr:DUF2637 domain-containing protein [Streptomyces sp. B-S-A6]MDI3402852.1 DUF2637 domain-containing protein [Streptomyces sp. B-S-A6]